MSPSTVYWILMLDNISATAKIVTWIGVVVSVVAIFIGVFFRIDGDEDVVEIGERLHKQLRWMIPTMLVFAILSVLIPDTKQAAPSETLRGA